MKSLEWQESFKVDISLASPEDARDIREVQYITWLATYPNNKVGITIEDVKDRFKDAFTEENIKKRQETIEHQPESEKIFIARVNGKIVGFCKMIKFENRNQLGAIYVVPDYQGKGFGYSLWNRALKFIDLSKNTFVDVADYNINAISFYSKIGFVDTGDRWSDEKFKMKSGATIPEMRMILKGKEV